MITKNRLAGIAFAALLAVVLAMPHFDDPPDTPWTASEFARSFPVRCEYLKRITEPIRIDHGNSYGDGGNLFVDIVDARGKWFYVCLKNDLDGDPHLTFTKPTESLEDTLPIGGPEEREFLGMLERWAESNPDTQERIREYREARRQRKPVNFSGPEMTNELLAKAVAFSIMNKLLQRNGKPRLW